MLKKSCCFFYSILLSVSLLGLFSHCSKKEQKLQLSNNPSSTVNPVLFHGLSEPMPFWMSIQLGNIIEKSELVRILNGYTFNNYLINELISPVVSPWKELLYNPYNSGISLSQPIVLGIDVVLEDLDLKDSSPPKSNNTVLLSALIEDPKLFSTLIDNLIALDPSKIRKITEGENTYLTDPTNNLSGIGYNQKRVVALVVDPSIEDKETSTPQVKSIERLRKILTSNEVPTRFTQKDYFYDSIISGHDVVAQMDSEWMNSQNKDQFLKYLDTSTLLESANYQGNLTVDFKSGSLNIEAKNVFSPEAFNQVDFLQEKVNPNLLITPAPSNLFFGALSMDVSKIKSLTEKALKIVNQKNQSALFVMEDLIPFVGLTGSEVLSIFDGNFVLSIDDILIDLANKTPKPRGYLAIGLDRSDYLEQIWTMYGSFIDLFLKSQNAESEITKDRFSITFSGQNESENWEKFRQNDYLESDEFKDLKNHGVSTSINLGKIATRFIPIAKNDKDQLEGLHAISQLDNFQTRISSNQQDTFSYDFRIHAKDKNVNILNFISHRFERFCNPLMRLESKYQDSIEIHNEFIEKSSKATDAFVGTWFVSGSDDLFEEQYIDTRNADGTYNTQIRTREGNSKWDFSEDSGTWELFGSCILYIPEDGEAFVVGISKKEQDRLETYTLSMDEESNEKIIYYTNEKRVSKDFKWPN